MILRPIKRVNPNIKVGDTVRINDSLGLSTVDGRDSFDLNKSYPGVTGYTVNLCTLTGVVLEVGITNVVSTHNLFLDVRIKLGNTVFFTCSEFLNKLSPYPKIVKDKRGITILAIREENNFNFSGVVLDGGKSNCLPGDFSSNWTTFAFTDFHTKVLLDYTSDDLLGKISE